MPIWIWHEHAGRGRRYLHSWPACEWKRAWHGLGEDLRALICAQLLAGPSDPRLAPSYAQECVPGFFAQGAKVAIQWEQVARMQELHVIEVAKACPGPSALVNTPDGEPDFSWPEFGVAGSSRAGQLVYYFQAVDRFRHDQERHVHIAALKFVNQSKGAGLMGMLGLFLGMRVRLTKEIKAPELVQEASGEVVGIVFHLKERFGDPGSTSRGPAAGHECWQRGWVKCDNLPSRVEIRFDGCTADYTGLRRPGVWFLEPKTAEWKLPTRKVFTVDHLRSVQAKKVHSASRRAVAIDVRRAQVPLCPELVRTFHAIQGTTFRGPEKQPKGLLLDVFRPSRMQGESGEAEYYQHLYTGLGRAERLDRILLRDFPRAGDGDLDWSILERGPPEFLVEVFHTPEKLAKRTLRRLVKAQRDLGMPPWEDCPRCKPDPAKPGRYLYDPAAWGRQRPEIGENPAKKPRRALAKAAAAGPDTARRAPLQAGGVSSAYVALPLPSASKQPSTMRSFAT